MAKRIYVGGLPFSTVEGDLESLFASSGTVASATVITDKYTGQSKGFGFVEMSTDAEADAAIRTLDGTMLSGRTLTVNEAKPREERTNSYGGNRSGGNRGGYGGGGDRNDNRGGSRW
jgi:RNA recognition motif-containing protein